jgi:peptidyl-prolyl cis-trans isomerase SDCCAG10
MTMLGQAETLMGRKLSCQHMEVDDDQGFMSHALHFPKDDGEESRKAERDFEVIDPRERGAKAKEEERERKRAMKAKGGGGRHRR